MRSGLLLFSMIIVATPALAIYKCETHGGILYTDIPCAVKQVELPPPPPASDAATARRLAQHDRAQLAVIEKQEDRLRSDRRRREAGQEKAAAAIKKRCTLLGLEKKWSAEDAASASHLVSEKSETLKRHARRKAERFDAECQSK
jgi:hypothetical protein